MDFGHLSMNEEQCVSNMNKQVKNNYLEIKMTMMTFAVRMSKNIEVSVYGTRL